MPAQRSTNPKSRPGPSKPRSTGAGAAAATGSRSGTQRHKLQALEHRSADGVPGLSKLKASIRQTKRLLQKEGLEPGLRIQTQRRLESLEADLAKSEKRSAEKKNGSKYHKIKFFERQKLLRIIKKQHRRLAEQAENTAAKIKVAEEKLEHARIMLNYVLHFPNSEKYISLFPPSTSEDPEDEHRKLPSYLTASPVSSINPSTSGSSELDKTARRRLDILHEIRRLMDSGRLSAQPEVDLAAGEPKERVDLGSGLRKPAKGGSTASVGEDEAAAAARGPGDESVKAEGRLNEQAQAEVAQNTAHRKDKKVRREKGDTASGKAAKAAPSGQGVKAEDDFFE